MDPSSIPSLNGSGSPSPKCFLRKVSRAQDNHESTLSNHSASRTISRDEAELLWKQGKIAGIFNIPFDSPQLFESCLDFCIEIEEGNVLLLLICFSFDLFVCCTKTESNFSLLMRMKVKTLFLIKIYRI